MCAAAAPCAPEILNLTQTDSSTYRVSFSSPNTPNTNYIVTAMGQYDKHTCQTADNSCELTQLPCGSTYDVMAVATTKVGRSLPGFSKTLETGIKKNIYICYITIIYIYIWYFTPWSSPRGPCCPSSINVTQVTQAMTNVTWSSGTGARSYITTLTSSRGNAKCHTLDTHCLMGCITCGTNYSVNVEAISSTGHTSECRYRGFSSSEKKYSKQY